MLFLSGNQPIDENIYKKQIGGLHVSRHQK